MAGTSVKSAKWRSAIAGGVLLAVMVATFGRPASAQEVQALICRLPAAVTVAHPANDTVLASGAINVDGTVRQASQLEVYIDGALDSIVPVGIRDTSYGTSVQLTEGTHTIKVVAIDACQISNAEASAVVTYQPAVATASTGASVPTTVAGAPGVHIGGPTASPVPSISGVPPFLAQPLQQLGEALDLSPQQTGPLVGNALPQVARFGLLTVGSLVVIFSQAISAAGVSGHMLQFAAQRLGLSRITGSRLIAALIGAGGIILAFLL